MSSFFQKFLRQLSSKSFTPEKKEDDGTAVATISDTSGERIPLPEVVIKNDGPFIKDDESSTGMTGLPQISLYKRSTKQQQQEAMSNWRKVLEFVAFSEETKVRAGSYGKEHKSSEDWSKNHFLQLEGGDGRIDTIITSYCSNVLNKKLMLVASEAAYSRASFSDDIQLQEKLFPLPHWLTFTRPLSERQPEMQPVPLEEDNEVRMYLQHIIKHDPHRFANADLEHARLLLEPQDMPPHQQDAKDAREFVLSALRYQVDQELTRIYKKLFQLQGSKDPEASEIVLGIGHVRAFYFSKDSEYERKIINGPLLEVEVDLKLADDESIVIVSHDKGKLKLNGEVMSALITSCDANSKVANELYQMAEQIQDLRCLELSMFLKKASLLVWNAAVRSPTDPNAHDLPQNDQPSLVLTPAWCLQWRRKMSTVFSRDARALVVASQVERPRMSDAVYALMVGPDVVQEVESADCENSMEKDALVYPLPASRAQRQIGHQLFVKQEPAILVQGPPGTGKTHSIVNVAAAGLSLGRKILVSSTNSRALGALIEKLPKELSFLCIDMASCEERGLSELHSCLQNLQKHLTNAKQKEERYKRQIGNLKEDIKSAKAERLVLEQDAEAISNEMRCLLRTNGVCDALRSALAIADKAPWMVKAALMLSTFCDLITVAASLHCDQEKLNGQIEVPMEVDQVSADALADLVRIVSKRAKQPSSAVEGTSRPNPPSHKAEFTFSTTSPTVSSDAHAVLSKIKVNGKQPSGQQEWARVLHFLRCETTVRELQSQLECSKEDIWNEEMRKTQKDFLALMKEGKKLREQFDELTDANQANMQKAIVSAAEARAAQQKHRKLTNKIQELESRLVFNQVIVALNQSLTHGARSKLVELTQLAGKLGNKILASDGPSSEKACRQRHDLTEAIQQALKFMPFLVMTTEQASTHLPPDHMFDLAILDEASQSNCCALTIMARCKQILVVGDDKQVSPSQCFLSEERINELKLNLPDIALKQHLLPESSFFDLFKPAFPTKHVLLHEHFRCVPGIIKVSNSIFYDNSLEPLRLAGEGKCLTIQPVKGVRDPKKKTNEAEAKEIANAVALLIDKAATGWMKPHTIGIISMGGQEQSKLLRTLVEEKEEAMQARHGTKAVKRHKILVGVPSQFQGDERDVVFLSAVYSSGNRALKPETDPADRKKWNVALTRAKNRMVLVHSFNRADLKNKADIRRPIFDHFLDKSPSNMNHIDLGCMLDVPPSGIQTKAKEMLKVDLSSRGYQVSPKGGGAWSTALCIGQPGSACGLVCLEHAGESEEDWQQMLDEQESLERAGRACLRVSCLSLALCFGSVLQDVLCFLEASGVAKDVGLAAEPTAPGSSLPNQQSECAPSLSGAAVAVEQKAKSNSMQVGPTRSTPTIQSLGLNRSSTAGKRMSTDAESLPMPPAKKPRAILDSDDEN